MSGMSTGLPPFPVDSDMLDRIEYAMQAAYDVDESGEHRLVGADYSLTQLLKFLSGHDSSRDVIVDGPDEVDRALGINMIEIWDCTAGGSFYTRDCVIRALIAEVRRLRVECAR